MKIEQKGHSYDVFDAAASHRKLTAAMLLASRF
jgi:hypothetical protein